VERHIGPKQLVLLEVLESRERYKSMRDYARAIAAQGGPRTNFMARLEGFVRVAADGVEREVKPRMIREAQREGLFLGKLSNYCDGWLAGKQRELDLETALLLSDYMVLGAQPDDPSEQAVEAWRRRGWEHHKRLLEIRAAVALIEDEYFDGAPILFRETREHLQANIQEISGFLERFDKAVARCRAESEKATTAYLAGLDQWVTPSPRVVGHGARLLAGRWVDYLRGLVLDEFGEKHEATQILNRLILEGDQMNPHPAGNSPVLV
jgi:hypothetical protein